MVGFLKRILVEAKLTDSKWEERELHRFRQALKEGTTLDPDEMSEKDLKALYRKLNQAKQEKSC